MNPLPERLAAQALRAPEAMALVSAGATRRVTYGELWARVGGLAGWLRAQGVVSGDRVAVFGDNGPEVVAATYATLSAGAVAVTLNAAARGAELAAQVRHAEARCLLAAGPHAELAALSAALPDDLPRLVSTPSDPPPLDATFAPVPADLDAPAVVLYTSGTTGAPKGVVLTHGNLAANTDSILAYLDLGPEDRALCLLPFYYAYGASVLHTHLSVGASLLLENSLAYPARVVALAAAERITGLPGVPSTFALLLRRGALDRHDLTSLRYATQAGGPMAPALADAFRAALPRVRLIVMYGQTEATARLTWLPPEEAERKRGSCGRAIPGVELRVVDPSTGAPLGPDTSGEVCARGPNVMAGYFRDPEATRAVLKDGWLHTGDVGRLDAEGYLFLDGRRGDMIKSGAHRISPLEVEAVAAQVPGVSEAVAVGVPDELLGQVVALYVLLDPRVEPAPDALAVQARCRAHLAAYKVPKRVFFVDDLPRGPTGKVQRHRLADLAGDPTGE
jgi:long-chain acyl-CoA synthetase